MPAHEVRFRGADDVWVRVDRAALNHALGNLIDNAIKYSPDGGTVTLGVRPTGEHVENDVTDEGVGYIDNVEMFAPFHRGRDETTATVAGTGLGLYIVRTLVEAMGGTVTARANQDRGSTFTIRLPAAP